MTTRVGYWQPNICFILFVIVLRYELDQKTRSDPKFLYLVGHILYL